LPFIPQYAIRIQHSSPSFFLHFAQGSPNLLLEVLDKEFKMSDFFPQRLPAITMFLLAAIVLCCSAASAQVTFEDVTESVGLTGVGGQNTACVDYNGDGWVDIYDGRTLWRNEKGEKFVKVEGIPLNGSIATWGDFDNDGLLDLYCSSNGKLFRNLGGDKFEDASGMMPERPMKVSRGSAWGDYDGDGFIDLYVGGYEVWPDKEYPDAVYRNVGGKSFKEVWRSEGKPLRARGITAADFDEDGDLDVYVSNYRLQPNLLWLNKGDGKFEEVAAAYGVAGDGDLGAWGHTVGSCWGDLDDDGHLDLFVGNFSHPAEYQDRPKFMKNLGPKGGFHFEDKSAAAGLRWQESFVSPALGDYDNDGDLDLFFSTFYPGDKSVLYRNEGKWAFSEVTNEAGVSSERTYQAVWVDFDNDGDLDLLTGGNLFRNSGNGNHWLKVQLEGAGNVNRSAIGAQVRLKLGEKTLMRQVESSTGEGNQQELVLHFGLGSQSGPVELTVTWPEGSTQKVTTEVDRIVKVSN
jgi:hypothetical protein